MSIDIELRQFKDRYFHKKDLSNGDGEATQKRLDIYNRLFWLNMFMILVGIGLAASPLAKPELAVDSLTSGALVTIALGVLVMVDSGHLAQVKSNNKK